MSKADAAGLKHGDLIREVNGEMIRDKSHEEVVQLLRQASESSDTLELTIVSRKNDANQDVVEENNEDEIRVENVENWLGTIVSEIYRIVQWKQTFKEIKLFLQMSKVEFEPSKNSILKLQCRNSSI